MATKSIPVDRIVGLLEIAQRTGSSPRAVWNWTKREGFPEPIARVSNNPVYDWNQIDKWNRSWVRSKGGASTHQRKKAA